MTTIPILTQSGIGVKARVAAGLISLFMGAGFILVIGFSHIEAVHNAAHDTRHSFAFPCH